MNFFSENSYRNERLIENIGFKAALLSTYIGHTENSRYKDNSIYKLDDLISWISSNNMKISELIDFEDEELLVDINYVLDVILNECEKGNNEMIEGINELFFFLQNFQKTGIKVLEKITENESSIKDFKKSINSVRWILKDFSNEATGLKVESFISKIKDSDKTDFDALQRWFKVSSSNYICTDGFCQENASFNEVEETLSYFLEDRSSRLFNSVKYLGNERNNELQKFISKIFSSITVN